MNIPYLSGLNDRITSSEKHDTSGILKLDMSGEIGDILELSQKLSELKINPELTLNVLDFDDTLHSRYNQLQRPIFQDNRGKKGNIVIEKIIGPDAMLQEFYSPQESVKRLLTILGEQNTHHKAMILTAGEHNWQKNKCEAVGVTEKHAPICVVEKSSQKPRELLNAIIRSGIIPGKIIVYEDRPEYFLKHADTISKILGGVEIVVNEVILSDRPNLKQISEIKQNIFSPLNREI